MPLIGLQHNLLGDFEIQVVVASGSRLATASKQWTACGNPHRDTLKLWDVEDAEEGRHHQQLVHVATAHIDLCGKLCKPSQFINDVHVFNRAPIGQTKLADVWVFYHIRKVVCGIFWVYINF